MFFSVEVNGNRYYAQLFVQNDDDAPLFMVYYDSGHQLPDEVVGALAEEVRTRAIIPHPERLTFMRRHPTDGCAHFSATPPS